MLSRGRSHAATPRSPRVSQRSPQPGCSQARSARPNRRTAWDGLLCSGPNENAVRTFRDAGGAGPRMAEMLVCVADQDEALQTIRKQWPNPAIPGDASAELPLPSDFEAAAKAVRDEDLQASAVIGLDAEPYLERIGEYARMGFTHVFLHQVGSDQTRFLDFAKRELLSAARAISTTQAA